MAPDALKWLPQYLLPFVTLSYVTDKQDKYNSFPNPSYYESGPKDVCLVITIIAVMAVLRDVLRLGVFEPLARWKLTRDLRAKHRLANPTEKANGHGYSNGNMPLTLKMKRKIHHRVLRFAEQGWSGVYYPVQWAFGMYIHSKLPTRMLDPRDVWIGYPHMPLPGPLKLYYLTQTAFYSHQIFILNAEEHRSDHWQMMAHHFITVFLMAGSYMYNFTRIGCLVMVLMDLCDIFFPWAKMIRYLNISQMLCDAIFACFLVSWLITRHGLFLIVIWSAIFDPPEVVGWLWDPPTGNYLTQGSIGMFVICLIALQIIQLLWFVLICRVAYRVITGAGAVDSRSDDDSELEDEDENEKEK